MGFSSIDFENVSVDFPVFNSGGRSIKSTIINVATGGQIKRNSSGVMIVRALDNLNFKIKHGERVALLGHNGAGKSTLLRVLCGVYKPIQGNVFIDGKIGSLIDISLGIDLEASGVENIYVRGRLLGMSPAEIKDKIADIIEYSELGDFILMPVRTYSTGMHMRLAFTISTALRPEILLMDEWLSVGDESFRLKAEARLKKVVNSSNIIVIATHSRELALSTCTRAIWLEHGKIKMDGSPEDVCESYFGKN